MIVPETRPGDQPVTEKYIEAVNLNKKILISAQMVQQDLYEMCTGLKQMRDGKLYKELGYKNFEEYVEAETGLKRRQVYNYIAIVEKLPSDFVHSSAQIGIKKLSLLATLDDNERAEITEKTDVESASVRELKAEIEKLKKENAERQSDNMSLSRQLGELQASYIDVQDDNDELKNEIAELKARPPKEIVIHSKEKIPDNSVSYQAYEEACSRYQHQIDELEHENLMLTRQAYAEKTELEEKLKAAGDKGDVRFRIYRNQLEDILEELMECIEDADNEDTAENFKRSIIKILSPVWQECAKNGGQK